MRAAASTVLFVFASACATAPCSSVDAASENVDASEADARSGDADRPRGRLDLTPSTWQLDAPCQPQRRDFVVTNVGTAPTGPVLVRLASTSTPSPFLLADTTCAGSLEVGQACVATIELSPVLFAGTFGLETADLGATIRATGETVSASLGVRVVTDVCGFEPLTPSFHSFGDVALGSSATQTFTLSNAGGMPIGPLDLWIEGSDWARFRVTPGSDTCTGAMLAGGGRCTLEITFVPDAPGLRSAMLVGNVTGRASLSGNGLP